MIAPYPGLRPFRTDEAPLYFGRDGEVVGLTERVVRQRRVILVGPSGSGKSSLINAGLIPQLQSGFYGDEAWCVVRVQPGSDPLGALATALAKSFPPLAGPELAVALRAEPDGLTDVLRAHGGERPILVIVDQFEEVFRFRPRLRSGDGWTDEVEHFVELLVRASRPGGAAHLLVGMRGEFVTRCAEFETLSELVNEAIYVLPPLTTEGVRRAVTEPAAMFGATVEDDVVVAFQAAAEAADLALPVLEHALRQVWDRATASSGPGAAPRIARAHLDELGGVQRALGRHADETLKASVDTIVAPADVELLFRRLCFVDAQGLRQRNPSSVSELDALLKARRQDKSGESPGALAVLTRFVEAGFLTVVDPSDGKDRPSAMVDLAHESILTRWDTLAGWLAEEAADVNRFRRLVDFANELYHPPDVMLPSEILTDGEALRVRTGPLETWAKRVPGIGSKENAERVEAMLRESRDALSRRELKAREEAARQARAEAEAAQAKAEADAANARADLVTAAADAAIAIAGRQRWQGTALATMLVAFLIAAGGAGWWFTYSKQQERLQTQAEVIASLSEELERSFDASKDLQNQVQTAEEAQDLAYESLRAAEESLSDQIARGSATELQLAQARAGVGALRTNYQVKKKELEALQADKTALESRMARLAQEVERFKVEATNGSQAVSALQKQVALYAEEIGRVKAERDSALASAQAQAATINNLQTRLSACQANPPAVQANPATAPVSGGGAVQNGAGSGNGAAGTNGGTATVPTGGAGNTTPSPTGASSPTGTGSSKPAPGVP